MIIDLEEKEVTGTFELAGGGKVHLRLLNSVDLKVMRKECFKKRVEYPLVGEGKAAHYQRFESEEFDSEKFQRMGWERNITGWDDLFDRDEKLIPVTTENKALLMERVPQINEAVTKGNKILQEQEKERAEAAEKN